MSFIKWEWEYIYYKTNTKLWILLEESSKISRKQEGKKYETERA